MPQGVSNIASSTIVESREYRWRWWALIGASLAVFMAALDSNVVNVALPVMARIFHVDREIRWVVLSYVLPTVALLGVFGALSDVIGRRRITLLGITLFILGSILCGTAQSLPQMVIYRIIQGIGGAAIGSAILAIATVNFAPSERGKAMAVIGLIAPLGAVVGPSLGGILIGGFGWPAIFFINNGDMQPVQVVLRQLIWSLQLQTQTASPNQFEHAAGIEALKSASVLVAAVPMLVIYPFIQRYFIKGIMLGAIKA